MALVAGRSLKPRVIAIAGRARNHAVVCLVVDAFVALAVPGLVFVLLLALPGNIALAWAAGTPPLFY